MSSWFDKLLEDLQRRQAEQDAQREGRPLPPREPRRARGNRGSGNGGDDGPPLDDRPTAFPRRPRSGGPFDPSGLRRWMVLAGILLLGLFLFGFLGRIVNLLTDLMWYDALGRRDVLTTRLWSQVGLFAFGLAAFAVPALASIWLARRIAPQVPIRRIGGFDVPDASRAVTWALVAVTGIMALVSAGAWSGSWDTILLFANGGDFGATDPNFGRDIGFYIFDLPFWRFLQGWAVASVIAILLLSLGAYAAGALRWQFRLSAPVRAHLSILGALLLGLFAFGYQLDIPELSYSTRGIGGAIQAATYTDMNAQVPAYQILTVVALGAAVLLLANIWFRTLWALVLAGGAWLGLSILVGGLYPAFVQGFQVTPNEQDVEVTYIARHIASTRGAFELDAIEQRDFTGEQSLTEAVFEQDAATIDNLRLWDYRPLLTTFGQDQILRRYYDFLDVDIDRYQVGGEQRQIMLSARELDVEKLAEAAKTWTNERLVYTHGYGITAVPVDAVTPQGQPDYLVSGINREPQLPVGEPRIYFGEATDTYVVTGTGTEEFDYPLDESSETGATTTWEGSTGVGIGNPLARFLFAMRFGDLNLLISNQLTDRSQVLFRRAIWERVPELAPFLVYDHDPYLVSAEGRLLWVWDAYTASGRYPNAQPLGEDSPFPRANYIRNSVKVVVDAYHGTVDFFVTDPNEPIIAAWSRIFPGLFQPLDAMPQELVAHLRYPEGLFIAQNEAYRLYHLPATPGGATTFYNQDDRWAIPEDVVTGSGQPMEPYYVIMRIPGEDAAEFVLIQPFVPEQRPNMIAWVAARMDPGVYGERIAFHFPNNTSTDGPALVEARIDQDDAISSQFSLWDRSGSAVIRGNLLVLPIGDDGLIYVEPIFLQASGAPFPEFVRVIMVSENRVAFAENVADGLEQLLGEAAPPPPDGGLPEDVAGLVAEAQRLYAAAQAALDAGDLGTYQARVDELQQILDALAELTGAATPSLEPSPSASP
ncbi:MAG TPA: UPF0182 family protein [Candidatus Dormibacteraeota bacterium]|nr:UPF0182 family protein [Candidatus Dormibacteraeota bacterium]